MNIEPSLIETVPNHQPFGQMLSKGFSLPPVHLVFLLLLLIQLANPLKKYIDYNNKYWERLPLPLGQQQLMRIFDNKLNFYFKINSNFNFKGLLPAKQQRALSYSLPPLLPGQ